MTDEQYKKASIVFVAIGVPAVAYLVVRYLLSVSAREGTLTPGSSPATVLATSPTGPCRAVPHWPFHLRREMVMGTEDSTAYPVGTELQILQAPRDALTRRGAKMYKVKVVRDGREGFVFLYNNEIVGDCRPAA